MTSIDETKVRIDERAGIVRRSPVLSSRLIFDLSMKLSTSILLREVYS